MYTKPGRVTIDCGSVSRTKQSFRKDCDINLIMSKYQKTGAISHFRAHSGEYGYATATTFQEAMNVVATGRSLFEGLPSSLRERFKNDPARFLEFTQDEANADEMVELGLVDRGPPELDPEVPAQVAADLPVVPASEPAAGDSAQ